MVKKTSTRVIVGTTAAVMLVFAFVGLIAWLLISNSQLGGGDGVDSGCEIEPYIDLTVKNAAATGTAVTVTVDANVNVGTAEEQRLGRITTGSSGQTFSRGDKVELLLNATNYINKIVKDVQITKCGANAVYTTIEDATTAVVIVVKNSDDDAMTDAAAGGAVNQTAIAAGGNELLSVEFKGTEKMTTGKNIFVVELSNAQNVSALTMDGTGDASVPDFYTDTLSSPYKKAFEVAAVKGATKAVYTLGITAKTGKIVSGAVYTTAYTIQAFAESDGSFVEGIEDAAGDANVEYENTADFDFYINEA